MKQSFPPLINSNSKVLILGTMPGEKSLILRQYYGNRGNQFWRLLFAIFGKDLSDDYMERVRLLEDNSIALWDVLEYCEREGSLDSKIKNERMNDLASLYERFPNIKYVFFSSKNAETYYNKYAIKQAGLQYDVLPSPSGANATMTFDEKLEIWKERILYAVKT